MKYREKNISFFWFRIFYVYGPGQRQSSLIPSITKSLLNNQLPDIKEPGNRNDFIYIDDVIDAMTSCIESKNHISGIYNLGAGIPTMIKTDYSKVAESLEKQSYDLTVDKKEHDLISFWANISKSKKYLNWSPKTNLLDGIQKYHSTII